MTTAAPLLGILMLDSRFPRILGDVGNKETWDFPVRYAVVEGATPDIVVRDDPEPLLKTFIEAGQKLVAEGCTGIATTCGFLAPMRQRLADQICVPVAASALEQAAQIQLGLPTAKRLGILTISKASLTAAHLIAATVPETSLIAGVDGTSFASSILGNELTLDVDAARRDITEAAIALQAQHPDLGAILLECTNMVPYAPDIRVATGLPVYSIYTHLKWFYEGLSPTRFPPSRNQLSQNA